jgi:hypothetical protein
MFLGDLVHPVDAGKRDLDYQADRLVDAVSPLAVGIRPTLNWLLRAESRQIWCKSTVNYPR